MHDYDKLIKNKFVYQPKIIRAWRGRPANFLDVRDGPLLQMLDERLAQMQRQLDVEIVRDKEYIYFIPNKIVPTPDHVIMHLAQNGLHVENDLRAPLLQGLGLVRYIQNESNEPQPNRPQQFANARNKATKKASIWQRLKDNFLGNN